MVHAALLLLMLEAVAPDLASPQPEAQHPKSSAIHNLPADYPIFGSKAAKGGAEVHFGSLSARILSLWISGGLANRSPAFAFSIKAAATLPLRCASRPASSSNVSKMAKRDGPSWIANHEIVPASAFTQGTAERRKSATSFSFPGFACNGTYSANFVIASSYFDRAS